MPRRIWTEPGVVACALLGTLLATFALSVDFPKAAFAFQSDEATYYSLAYSLARDGDFTYERRDLERVWPEFPTGPEGIFLKRGHDVSLHATSHFPFLELEQRPDSRTDRAYYAKSFIYPLAAAPFVLLFGTNGFLLLHALLLTLDLGAAYALLRARASPVAALSYACVFFFASAAPVYFVWLTPEIFNLSIALYALFLWAYKEVAPVAVAASMPTRVRGDSPESRPDSKLEKGSARIGESVSARPSGMLDRWSRFLRSPASTYAAAALVGVLMFSKPPYGALLLPMLALALWRRQWRTLLIAGGMCMLVAGGLFTWNLVVTGEMNYQGGDRNTFYGGSGFPFQTSTTVFRSAAGIERGRSGLLTEILFSRDALFSVFPHNLVYFMLGRHTGLVPYFFPGVLSLILFFATYVGRWRRRTSRPSASAKASHAAPASEATTVEATSGEAAAAETPAVEATAAETAVEDAAADLAVETPPLWQWLVLATFACACAGMLLLVPYTYSGGGGPIGNRYFMGFYPMLLFVTPALRSPRPALLAMVIGGLFTTQLVLNPFYASYHPAEHVKSGPYRWLPVELTLLNDLPINVTPSRIKQPLPPASGGPPTLAYFLDDNAYPLEGEWFWVRGRSRTELLLRGPAVARADGGFDSLRIRHLTIQVQSGDVANHVTIHTDSDRSTVTLEPHSSATVTLRVGGGMPYHRDPGLPTSYVYWIAIASDSGFVPMFSSGTRDSRHLGAMVKVTPTYEPTSVP
jgi:hypothetical protein